MALKSNCGIVHREAKPGIMVPSFKLLLRQLAYPGFLPELVVYILYREKFKTSTRCIAALIELVFYFTHADVDARNKSNYRTDDIKEYHLWHCTSRKPEWDAGFQMFEASFKTYL